MKRILIIAFLVAFVFPSYGQSDYLPVREYKAKSYIKVVTERLSEYTIRDSSLVDVLSGCIQGEKRQKYYDKDGYILLKKYARDSLEVMSIYPNMYGYSFYGSYDGVLYLNGHTFIVSIGENEPCPFISTGRSYTLEFLDYSIPRFGCDEQGRYYHLVRLPDPYETGYQYWRFGYDPEEGVRGEVYHHPSYKLDRDDE